MDRERSILKGREVESKKAASSFSLNQTVVETKEKGFSK